MKKILLTLFLGMLFSHASLAATYTIYDSIADANTNTPSSDFGFPGPLASPTVNWAVMGGDDQHYIRYVKVSPSQDSKGFGAGTKTPGNVHLDSFTITDTTDVLKTSSSTTVISDSIYTSLLLSEGIIYLMDLQFDVAANTTGTVTMGISSVPLPAAVWLFGSALMGLVGVSRRKSTALAA